MTPAIQPVKNNERIWIMDALRGFAILGIFIANLFAFTYYMMGPLPDAKFISVWDQQVQFWHHVLIEGKFYSIFSFLFGWGIALQLMRNKTNSISFIRRRLFIMILLGMSHIIFLWFGDIVAFYGMVGFILLWMRNWKAKTLFITSIALILSPILLYFLKMNFLWLNAPAGILFQTGEGIWRDVAGVNNMQEAAAVIHQASYADVIKLNMGGLFFRFGDLFFQSRIPKVLGMFILGYLMGRDHFFKSVFQNKKLLWRVAVAGLLIGLPANFMVAKFMETDGYYNLKTEGFYQTIAYAFGVAPLALSYIALFMLASRVTLGRYLLQQLRPVGKMAFTNYIMHSAIGVVFFTGAGFGMDRQVGPLYYTLFAIVVFIFQMVVSRIWLQYFEYGPVEWLWRSATYGKFQNLKKQKHLVIADQTGI